MRLALSLPCPPRQVDDFLSQPTASVIECVARAAGPILVLGAGGKMGLHLSLMLHKAAVASHRDTQVIAVSRFQSLHAREEFESHGLVTRDCDLLDLESLSALPDAPTVFYLAGLKFGTATAPEVLYRANVVMPSQVAERFLASRIVAFSTGCVYPFVTPDSGGATEATPVSPVGDYAASCLGRENAFLRVSEKHGTRVALIRLNYAVEFRYGVLVDIAQKVHRGEPVDVTMGYLNAIWQPDAIAHSIRALDLAASPAVPVNVTGSATLSVRALAERFGELLDRKVQIVGQEAETAWLNDASHSHRLFGSPPTSLESMMHWIAAWIKEGGETWGKPTGFAKRDGRF